MNELHHRQQLLQMLDNHLNDNIDTLTEKQASILSILQTVLMFNPNTETLTSQERLAARRIKLYAQSLEYES